MDNYTIGGMITDASQIAELFAGMPGNNQEVEEETKNAEDEETKAKDTQEEVAENVNPLELFKRDNDERSEKVGNDDDEDSEEKKEPTSKTETGSSPKNNPYSSIAYAMFEEGVLSNLSEDDLKEVKDGESLVAVMDKYIETRYDEQQKRVINALNAGIEKSVVKQYEDALQELDNVTEESIEAEDQAGENLRKAIIYQYYIDKGESKERATKMVERALSGGTDVEDAKDFLEELKISTKNKYDALVQENKRQLQEYKKQQEASLTKAKKAILEDEHILGNVAVDKQTRQKALDYWLKPTYKKEDGTYQSEIQKYAEENPEDFQIKLALLFALSDKFKNLENIAKDTVKREKKKAMKELEAAVNGTQRTGNGIINFGFKDDDSNFSAVNLASPEMWKR